MSSSSNSQSEVDPPSPGISDEKSCQCTMKITNGENSANEDDNRNSQKHNVKVSSRKRDEPEGEIEHKHEYSNNKRARVSVACLHEPEPESPASFNTLDDDCLGNVLDFVGKKCYSAFGRVNKRCHEMFCSKGYPKETYLYGYVPLRLIQQKEETVEIWYFCKGCINGMLHFNRRDIIDWMFTDETRDGYYRLGCLCFDAIKESSSGLDILREVFCRANGQQLEHLYNTYETTDILLNCRIEESNNKEEN